MKDIFSSHFASDDERRRKIWQDCFFVFDTNVLTAVYKRSDHARDAFYEIVRSLGDRLWVPYQVGYEFLDNRAKIAHDQSRLYADAAATLQSFLDSLDVVTRHPFLSKDLHEEFVDISLKVIDELEEKMEFHRLRLTNDDVKLEVAELFAGKVGDKYDDAQLKLIIKEGEGRYANQIPPGFQDINKFKGSPVFGEICKRYGDLIIWKQVIEKAKAQNKPVIMVTEEQKEDWWEKCGGRIIGPLPQLIEEFAAEVGQDFYLYSYHSFLNLANEYLEQNTSAEVIDEVREAAIDEAAAFTSVDTFDANCDVTLADLHSFNDLPWNKVFPTETQLLNQQIRKYNELLRQAAGDKLQARMGIANGPAKKTAEGKSRNAIYRARELAADARIADLKRRISDAEMLILAQSEGDIG